MTLFSVMTLIFCVINLCIQTFIRTVMFAVELIKKERDKEKKQKDSASSPPPITLTTSLLANEMQDVPAENSLNSTDI